MEVKVKAAWVSVLSNSLLVAAKLTVGLVIGSVSVVSEAVHSANDLLASFIALLAVKRADRPPDEQHNFGHGKIENISGIIEALLIFAAAAMIIKEAVDRILHGGEIMSVGWGLAVMGLSAAVNLAVSTYLIKVSRSTGSIALEADGVHLRTDVYTSLGVFAGLVLIRLTGLSIIDPIAAILVALLIIRAAWDLTRRAAAPLLDEALSPQDVEAVKSVLDQYRDDFIGYHQLRTRRAGQDCHIDLHLVTCRQVSVEEVHQLSEQIEEQIEQQIPNCQVLIHFEPHHDSQGCTQCRLLPTKKQPV